MRDSLKRIVDEFSEQTDAIQKQLDLIEYLVRGAPALPGLAISKTQNKNMAVISRSFSQFVSAQMRAQLQNGSIIIAAAFFEEAVRKIIADALTTMRGRAKNFHNLNQAVQQNQIHAFLSRFGTIKTPVDLFKVEHIAQLQNMILCAEKGEGYTLLFGEIAKNKNNMRSSEIAELCGRIGIKKVWEKLAAQKELQDYLGQYNTTFVTSEATSRLNSFIDTRNELIHSNPAANTFGKDWINDQMQFLRTITLCTGVVVHDYLK